MNPKYLKYGLYTAGFIIVLFIVYIIYNQIKKVGNDAQAIADGVHDNQQNKDLTKVYDTDKATIDKCRKIANNLAYELETLTDAKSISWTHFTVDSRLKNYWKEVSSATEAKIVANLYKNNFTNGRNLYADLKNNFTSAITGINYFNVKDFPFISNIQ